MPISWNDPKKPFLSMALAMAGLALAAAPAPAGPDAACLSCHGQKGAAKFVDPAVFAKSVHGANGCTSCHSAVDLNEHPGKPVAKVSCAQCHDKATATFEASAHGRARKAGNTGAAQCSDCHGTHDIAPARSPQSPVSRGNMVNTCAMCHPDAAKDFQESVHGQRLAAGVLEAPSCTDCHSDHAIETLKGAPSMKVAQQVCSRCHGSARINDKFGMAGDRVSTFFDSYHGMAVRMGSTTAANCASCHGYHLVLPSSDPRSSVNKANLVKTCQKCHANATENFTVGTVHAGRNTPPSDLGGKVDQWVRSIYLSLIFGVIGAMVVHNFLILRRKALAALRDPNRTVVRMSLAARLQHGILASTFIFLVVSGFALKYPENLGWLMGHSEEFRRIGHRVAACIMMSGAVAHLIFLIFTREGRRFFLDMLPEVKDVTDVFVSLRHYLMAGAPRPRFKRFGYAEKMEYWSVVWGTFLMGATGLLIWFKIYTTRWLPRWVVDVSITAHFYEAALATLAILVWHFYFIFFDPDVYPINWAWLDGKVTPHHLKEEHPLDPQALALEDPGSARQDEEE